MHDQSSTPLNPKTKNLLGHPPFGSWTVEAFSHYHQGNAYWSCRCACGTISQVAAMALLRGTSTSCGCQKAELSRKAHTTHGMSYTPEHYLWRAMIQRCTNPKNKEYPRYGGSGIAVCHEWLDSFEAFYADMGPRPTPQHTLERLKNSLGYTKDNVVWATHAEQALNRSTTTWVTHDNLTLCVKDWAKKQGIKRLTLRNRLKAGWSIEDALFTPASKHNTHLHEYKR